MVTSKLLDRLFSYTSKKNNIYIIPTKFGFLYIGILFTIFLIGLSYANNLTLLVAFSMLTFFIIQMLSTHKILQQFEYSNLKISSNYSDEGIKLGFNSKSQNLNHINILLDLEFKKYTSSNSVINSQGYSSKIFIPRGKYYSRKIRFFTNGESSLFYVWRNINFERIFFSYPERKYFNFNQLQNLNTSYINEEEFSHHIKYTNSLPAKRIDWKVFAKNGELFWKKHLGVNHEVLLFKQSYFKDTKENNLSYLSYLCHEAYKNDYYYSLETENGFIKEGHGSEHLKNCLEKLSEL